MSLPSIKIAPTELSVAWRCWAAFYGTALPNAILEAGTAVNRGRRHMLAPSNEYGWTNDYETA